MTLTPAQLKVLSVIYMATDCSMEKPNPTDWTKARDLVRSLIGNPLANGGAVDMIARAIAAAREEGYMSGFATCYREQKDAATRAAAEAARKDTTT